MKNAANNFTMPAKFIGAILNMSIESMEKAGFTKKPAEVFATDTTTQQNRDMIDADLINTALKAMIADIAIDQLKSNGDIVVLNKSETTAIVPIRIYKPFQQSANQSYIYEKNKDVWSLAGCMITSGDNRSEYPMIEGSFNKDGTIELVFDMDNGRTERIVFEKGNRGDYVEKSRTFRRPVVFQQEVQQGDDVVDVPASQMQEGFLKMVDGFSKATEAMIQAKTKPSDTAEQVLSKAEEIIKAGDQAKRD